MSKQLAQNVKGTRDFLPVDALKRNWLKKKIIGVFEKWGYDPLETPTMEEVEMLLLDMIKQFQPVELLRNIRARSYFRLSGIKFNRRLEQKNPKKVVIESFCSAMQIFLASILRWQMQK
jgi:hypothetical protein